MFSLLPEKITGLSIFSITIEFPSTGDLTIPTIWRFCSHGARLLNLTLANRAAHFDRPCLKQEEMSIHLCVGYQAGDNY